MILFNFWTCPSKDQLEMGDFTLDWLCSLYLLNARSRCQQPWLKVKGKQKGRQTFIILASEGSPRSLFEKLGKNYLLIFCWFPVCLLPYIDQFWERATEKIMILKYHQRQRLQYFKRSSHPSSVSDCTEDWFLDQHGDWFSSPIGL